MTIETVKNGSETIVKLNGRLDTMTSPQLEEALETVLPDPTDLTFDLDELEYISSAGLRVLLKANNAKSGSGQSMRVIHSNESIMDVFDMTGFSDILTLE